MTRPFASLFILLLWFCSCSTSKEDLKLESVIESLDNANGVIDKNCIMIRNSLQQKANDLWTASNAAPVLISVEKILDLSKRARVYFTILKKQRTPVSIDNFLKLFDEMFLYKYAILEAAGLNDDSIHPNIRSNIKSIS